MLQVSLLFWLFVIQAVVEEDEIKVLKHISNHPNFVKTYLVANKSDGKFKQVILMEKCGMYLINLTSLFW